MMSDSHDDRSPDLLTCEEAIDLLARYLDGELGEEPSGRLEEHLQRCRSCYSRHEFEKGLKRRIAGLGREPIRPEFERRIRGLVSRFSGGRREADDSSVPNSPEDPISPESYKGGQPWS